MRAAAQGGSEVADAMIKVAGAAWTSPQAGLKANQAEGTRRGNATGSSLPTPPFPWPSRPHSRPSCRHRPALPVDTYAAGRAASLEKGPGYDAIWKGQIKSKKEEKRSTFGRRSPKEKKIIKYKNVIKC